MSTRIYTVTDGITEKLVRAVSPAQAIAHISKGLFSAKVASQADMERLLIAGKRVQVAGEAQPDQKALEFTIELSAKATAAADLAINGPKQDEADPEPEEEASWHRDNDALYDTLLLLPEAVTGFGNDDEANMARVQSWTDEEAQEIERYAAAALDPNVPDEAVPPIPVLLQQRPLPL
jgi:hypothetical protein